jgi:bacillithiol synthase
MECTCIRHTDLPHTTKLFADFVYHFDRVQSFYRYSPAERLSSALSASKMDFPDSRRAALVEALRAQNGDSEELRLLAKPGTVAVVTGQQVGFLSGPAYTVYKALTAVKLARELTENGLPAVPVFWLATEDHDFAEIERAWVFDKAHHPLALDADGALATGGPVGQVRLPSVLPMAELKQAIAELPFGEEVMGIVEQDYKPGETFGTAFSKILKSVLSQFGLLHIDPMAPAIREIAKPTLSAALEHAPELTAKLLERNKQLMDAGYHAQVHVEDHTSLVFLLDGGKRIALKRKDQDYLTADHVYSTDELIEKAERLSPNALLRPVVQDTILPTVAYIGGPAELAYLAQSEVIYRTLLGRMPLALPRAGFTLFDQRSAKLMRKFKLALPDLFHGEDFVRDRIAASLVPPAVSSSLEAAKQVSAQALEKLSTELTAFDPTLAAALANSRKKIEHQLSKMEHKIRRESIARDDRAGRDSASLSGLLYPEKHLQERLYSIVPFLAEHGLALVDHVYENIHLDCPDHKLLVV